MALRRAIWDNLRRNGDFETAPAGTIATTSTSVYITGTAVGSATDDTYAWATNKGGTASAQFDSTDPHSGTYCMKLSLTATGSFMYARTIPGTATHQKLRLNTSPILPSTSYTIEYWAKTAVTSGTATSGMRMAIVQYNGVATALTTTQSTPVITTTDWTKYSMVVVTQAGCNFIELQCRFVGNDGTATLIGDAWFDDITVRPTIEPVRTAV